MTKDEAIQWMRLGAKCEHRYFSTGEWVSIDEIGMYVLEDGMRCTPEEFWRYRTEEYWCNDWVFAEGHDMWTDIASRVFSCPADKVTETMRDAAKRVYRRHSKKRSP